MLDPAGAKGGVRMLATGAAATRTDGEEMMSVVWLNGTGD